MEIAQKKKQGKSINSIRRIQIFNHSKDQAQLRVITTIQQKAMINWQQIPEKKLFITILKIVKLGQHSDKILFAINEIGYHVKRKEK